MWIVIRINHWAIHLMPFKGPITYASNLHFRISIKVFIENYAASSSFKKKKFEGYKPNYPQNGERYTDNESVFKKKTL